MKTAAKPNPSQKSKTKSNTSIDTSKELISIAQSSVDEVLHLFDTSIEGLSEADAKKRLEKSGLNEIQALSRIKPDTENKL